jgi:regulator of sigma E protease
VFREGKELQLTSNVTEEGTLGFEPELLLNYTTIQYSLGESIAIGTDRAFGVVFDNIKAFGKIFRGEVSATKSLSGPIGIAQILAAPGSGKDSGISRPVIHDSGIYEFPAYSALDGGHVMFLMYEMVSGRSPSDKFLEVAQKVGMVILLSLMVFAIANDTFNCFNKVR